MKYQRNTLDPRAEKIDNMRRGRIVSLDSSPYFDSSPYVRRSTSSTRQKSDEDEYDPMAFRSQSAAERVMQPLPFNRVQEDIQHPLSSKRSCSEFNDFGSAPIHAQTSSSNRKSKSFWKKLFSSSRSSQSQRHDPRQFESFSSTSSTLPFMESVPDSDRSYPRNRYKSSISEEVGIALDFVFGYNTKQGELPMEIELKVLNHNQLTRSPSSRGSSGGEVTSYAFSRTNSLRSVRSGRSSRSNSFVRTSGSDSTSALSDDDMDDNASISSMSSLGYNYPPQFQYMSYACWRDYVCNKFEISTLWFRRYCVPGDNDFFYNLQIQPFSSGIYLRGMLAAGSNNLLFHTYTLIFLPAEIKPFWSPSDKGWFDVERVMVTLLVLQVVFNLLAAPVRIILHYECWQTTRAYDTDRASHALQDLINSNVWLLNRILVWILDSVGVLVIVLGELYLCTSTNSSPLSGMFTSLMDTSCGSGDVSIAGDSTNATVIESWQGVDYDSDPLSSLIVDMCATNILSLILRAVVCLLYYLSIADPDVLNGKRRRKGGLSNFDLDLMPTFVFTDSDEVVNNECSICLTNFEMGEMLISLPCHQRHSFHANCIREWLQHDAKCPLCQKGI